MKKLNRFFTLYSLVIVSLILFTDVEYSWGQTFPIREQRVLNGDMTIIGNNILSKDGMPYNGTTGANDGFDMQFYNVDPANFSRNSSSADLTESHFGQTRLSEASCSRVKYAGLYWVAIYQQEAYDNIVRYNDFDKIKIKTPGSSTPLPITADNIIHDDGYSYVCYKDITSILQGLSTVTGTYTVGEMRASIGRKIPYYWSDKDDYEGVNYLSKGGTSAGWMLVIIYENSQLTAKKITTFDGHTLIRDGNPATFKVSGYQTPSDQHFEVKLAASTLEGDYIVDGDFLKIRRDSDNNDQILGVSSIFPNNQNNFFDSSISIEHQNNPNRNPNSINTLGLDIDYFTLENPNYEWIAKGDTEATFVAGSVKDNYELYFTAFNVETIAPRINLLKEVRDEHENLVGNNGGVIFGQKLIYDLTFENVGNDDADEVIIIDILPKNVKLVDVQLPQGVEPLTGMDDKGYDENSHTLKYRVTNNDLVKIGAKGKIRIFVQVVNNCNELKDVCSNEIVNQAKISYRGVLNRGTSLQYSSSSFDDCGNGNDLTTNFLVVDNSCKIVTDVPFCGNQVVLEAGEGYDAYSWTKSDALDVVIGTTRTLTVTESMGDGTYIVSKGTTPEATRCQNSLKESFVVKTDRTPELQKNPFRAEATKINTCSNDSSREYIQFNICGNEGKELKLSRADSDITWYRMTSVPTNPADQVPNDCPYFLDQGTWAEIKTERKESKYTVEEEGRYAVKIWNYKNGCGQVYYFRAYKSNLEFNPVTRNIICDSPGTIKINGLSAEGHQYRVEGGSVSTTWQPVSVTTTVSEPGWYKILVRKVLSNTSLQDNVCVYEENKFISRVNVEEGVEVTSDPVKCKGRTGSIHINIAGGIYTPITVDIQKQGSTGSLRHYTINKRNEEVSGLLDGAYWVKVTTPDGCDITRSITVAKVPDLVIKSVAAEPSCENSYRMNVQVEGGTLYPSNTYGYKIVGIPSDYRTYPNSGHSVAIDFEDTNFTSGTKTYVLEVIDANNCTTSKTVSITYRRSPSFTLTKEDIYCSKLGQIHFNVTNPTSYVEYFIRKRLADGSFEEWSNATGRKQINNPDFFDVEEGFYEAKMVYTIGSSDCETQTKTIEITEKNAGPVTASAGVIEVGCDSSGKAKVKIANAQGGDPQGTPPQYYYSFDNLATWTTTNEVLLDPGTHTLYVSDRNSSTGCVYPMVVTIPDVPTEPVFTASITSYDCEGNATVSITSNQTSYTYEYEYPDGTRTTSNVMSGLSPGTHTIKVYYSDGVVPTPSVLFKDDFGVGAGHFKSFYVNKDYYFEPQNGSPTLFNGNGNSYSNMDGDQIYDGEYAVTNKINPVYGGWLSPNDHTSKAKTGVVDPNGRFLAINLGNTAGNGGVIYERTLGDYDASKEIQVKVFAYNLIYKISQASDPEIKLQLVNSSGVEIESTDKYVVPKNRSADDWHQLSATLNPRGNASLFLRIRSYNTDIAGNDLVLDDIYLYQDTKICPRIKEISVNIPTGKAFSEAENGENITHQKCAGTSDGSYSLAFNNVGAGYEYRLGSSGTWIPSTANPLVINSLNSGDYTLNIRKDGNANCTITKSFTIKPASIINLDPIADKVIPCNQTSVDVTASATGGAGGLTYILQQPDGTIVSNTNATFGLSQIGTYTMSVEDLQGCGGAAAIRTFKVISPSPPVLSVDSSSQYCLSSSSSATVVLKVSGGTGPYKYSMNGVLNTPADKNTFDVVNPGTYTFTVEDSNHCTATQVVTIEPSLQLSAIKTKDITCDATPNDKAEIKVTVTGGYPNYTYKYQVDGGGYQNIPGAVGTTATEVVLTTSQEGTYQFKVSDGKNCIYEMPTNIVLKRPVLPVLSLHAEEVKCKGGATSLEVTIDKGVPYYSLNIQGVAYSATETITTTGTTVFSNVPAGTYTVTLQDSYNCTATTKSITIKEPKKSLSGFANVSALVSCSPNEDQAEVRVTNVQGGTPPYSYQFGEGKPFIKTVTGTMDVGDGVVTIKDANGCEITRSVTVVAKPTPPVIPNVYDTDIIYNCDGTADFVISPTSSVVSYTYDFYINGVLASSTLTSTGLFKNVPAGTHSVVVHYEQAYVPYNLFFEEDFGEGPVSSTVPTEYMSTAYTYEDQITNSKNPLAPCEEYYDICEGEYAVTNYIRFIQSSWEVPKDLSNPGKGRFLVVNLGEVADHPSIPVAERGVVYQRDIVGVDPSRPLVFEVDAYNLLSINSEDGRKMRLTAANKYDLPTYCPNLEFQLYVQGQSTPIATIPVSNNKLPLSVGPDDWKHFSVEFETNGYSDFTVKLKAITSSNSGNDVAFDNIRVYQRPKECGFDVSMPVVVRQGKAFSANDWVPTRPISCHGDSDGEAKITVSNFLPAKGFEYSVDGTNTTTTTASSVTITGLNAGLHTLTLSYINEDDTRGCELTRTLTLVEPEVLSATSTITTPAMCKNDKFATVRVDVRGGTQPYRYEVDNSGTYQTSNIFSLASGTHTITIQDKQGCSTQTTIEVVEPKEVKFTATPTLCYTGGNNGTIEIEVLDGNGDYKVQIGEEAAVAVTNSAHTITGLSPGTYKVKVTDGYGCYSTTTVKIHKKLTFTTKVKDISCKDGSISILANGGSGTYEYAIVKAGDSSAPSYVASSVISVTGSMGDGDYTVYVKDTNSCTTSKVVRVEKAEEIALTATLTHPRCYEDNANGGAIQLALQGVGVFDIDVSDASGTIVSSKRDYANNKVNFYGLATGTYVISATDYYGCVKTETITIDPAPNLLADYELLPEAPVCNSNSTAINPTEYGFTISATVPNLPSDATLQYTADGGNEWKDSNKFMNIAPGSLVYPGIIIKLSDGTTLCPQYLPEHRTRLPISQGTVQVDANYECSTGLSVKVTTVGGFDPYQFSYSTGTGQSPWVPADSPDGLSHTFTGLTPGRSYIFYVKDNFKCKEEAENIYDKYTPKTKVTIGAIKHLCHGSTSGGSVEINVAGDASSSYDRFSWEVYKLDGATGAATTQDSSTADVMYSSSKTATFTISNLPKGRYYVKITEKDAGGVNTCSWGSKDFSVKELKEIEVSDITIQPIGCSEPGIISIGSVANAVGDYKFELSGGKLKPGVTITSTARVIEVPRSKLQTPIDYDNTTLDLKVTDSNGCEVTVPQIIEVATKPSLDVTVDNCSDEFKIDITPYQYNSNQSGATTITVNAADYVYSIDDGANYFDNGGVFDVSSGTYTITVRNKVTGCTSAPVTKTVYPKLEVDAQVIKPIQCKNPDDAEIKIDFLDGSGTYKVEYKPQGSTSYSSLPLFTATSTVITAGNVHGQYAIRVTDENNPCQVFAKTFNLAPPVKPEFTATATTIACKGGTTSIRLQIDKGVGPYQCTMEKVGSSGPTTTITYPTQREFANIEEGKYKITVVGDNGCKSDTIVEVTANSEIDITNAVTDTQFACSSENTMDEAMVIVNTASITGGSGAYTEYEFKYTPASGSVETQQSANPIFKTTNKSGGSVEVVVRDSNGCTNPTPYVVTIDEFDEIKSASISVTQTKTCPNDEEIKINVVTKNAGNLEFRKDGGAWQTSPVFTGLKVGIHNFLIKHTGTGCEYPISHQVKEPNTFRIKQPLNITNPVCKGDNGSVSFELEPNGYDCSKGFKWRIEGTVFSGSTSYDSGWLNELSSCALSTPHNSLKAGNYTLTVTLAADPKCIQVTRFTISESATALTATTKLTPQSCAGSDAKVEFVNTSGGWGNYTYYVGTSTAPLASDYKPDVIWKNLGNGTNTVTYYVWVKDKAGCEKQLSDIEIGVPTPISATLTVTQANCANNAEGRIQVQNVSGGAGTGYQYQLKKEGVLIGVKQNVNTFTNLPSGEYYAVVTDGWTCSVTVGPVYLYDMIPFNSVQHEVLKEISCTSPTGAKVKVVHSGGSTHMQYNITSADGSYNQTQTSDVFDGLNYEGNYTISVRDLATGCNATTGSFSLVGTKPVSYTVQTTSPTCHGNNNGKIEVNLIGDTSQSPYVYRLFDNTGSETIKNTGNRALFTDLSAGTYTLTVTSARSCTITQTVELGEPDVLTVSHTVVPFACNAANNPQQAELTISVAGGTPPYSYSLDGARWVPSSVSSHTFFINDTGVNQNITYYVKDNFGCAQIGDVTIKRFLKLNDVVATSVRPATCGQTEKILVEIDGGGVRGFEVKELTTGSTIVIPAGSSQGEFDNIQEPGSYIFEATSIQTGCKLRSVPYVIEDYRTIRVRAIQKSPISCITATDGQIELEITGYPKVPTAAGAPYSYEVLDALGNSLSPVRLGYGDTSTNTLISNLAPGTYKVRVTEQSSPNCTTTSTLVTINAPAKALTVSMTQITDLTCEGNDAVIRVMAEGGWGDYRYKLYRNNNPITTFTTTTIFEKLQDGRYVVEVMDKYGCSVRSDDTVPALDIPNPTPIQATFRANPASLNCHDSSNGTIEVYNVTGGSGNYRYSLINEANGVTITTQLGAISSGIGSTTFTGLSEGTYRVEILDGWNCGSSLTAANVVIINAPAELIAEANITKMPTCATNAEITITATGGTPPYEYVLATGGSYRPITNKFMAPRDQTRTYVFYVKDSKGCPVATNEVTINKVEPITPSINTTNSVLNITCHGDNSGVIVVDAVGGVGTYTYELTGSFVDTTNPDNPLLPISNSTGEFRGLTAGNYAVKVTNPADGCIGSSYEGIVSIPIGQAVSLVVDIATSTDVKCNSGSDGSIEVRLSGGTGAIQYAISPNLRDFYPDTNQPEFKNLPAGDYTVIAKDSNGCSKVFDFKIKEPAKIVVSVVSTTDELCYGANDGTLTYRISGGNPPYKISIDNSKFVDAVVTRVTSTTVEGTLYDLSPVTNGSVFVKDSKNCESESYPLYSINSGVDLQATVTLAYTCLSNTIGQEITAMVVASETTNMLKYVLDEGTPNELSQTSTVFTTSFDLGGRHKMTFYHKDGCTKEIYFDVEKQLPITIESIDKLDLVCAGDKKGRIQVNTTDIGRSLMYSISPDPNNVGPTTSNAFEELSGGTYTITISDNLYGCITETSVTIIEPAPLVASVTHKVDESCYGKSDGELSFTITGGRPDYSYVLRLKKEDYEVDVRNGFSRDGELIELMDLVSGKYNLYFKDSGYNGDVCEASLADEILIRRAPNLASATIEVDYVCPTASNTTITNKVNVIFSDEDFRDWDINQLTYALNSVNPADAIPFDGVESNKEVYIENVIPGTGQFITLFFRGCEARPFTRTFDVDHYDVLVISDLTDPNEPNLIKVEAGGGKPIYQYYFNNEDYGSNNEYHLFRNDPTEIVDGKEMKKIIATVIDDLGCTADVIIYKEFIDIIIPDHFTPNNDGYNDTWGPKLIYNYPNIETFVYDRQGRLITKLKQGETWDGTYRGKRLPTGDYWYLIYLNETEDDSRVFKGNFNMYR